MSGIDTVNLLCPKEETVDTYLVSTAGQAKLATRRYGWQSCRTASRNLLGIVQSPRRLGRWRLAKSAPQDGNGRAQGMQACLRTCDIANSIISVLDLWCSIILWTSYLSPNSFLKYCISWHIVAAIPQQYSNCILEMTYIISTSFVQVFLEDKISTLRLVTCGLLLAWSLN